ncbi:hypothetical protein [Nocardioides pinisoli]|uniref:STAS domain-containing protein n=1 Tax=Nocardioides pinisoli TaxID=2950279 RepID=A0ABT1KZC1_9ACTN|nr:hypothetical protein [Nocardioides pinisoli]MCP3423125.1 hypothetical protein [Nocardioides pinisoli]
MTARTTRTFRILSATETDVVSLGQSRDDVRGTLGDFRTFRRTPDSEEADQFVDSGAMATYDADGLLVLLELADSAEVEIEGVRLVGESVESLVEALGAKGIEAVPDEMGALVPSLSVGLYAPGGTVEGVGLGSD